MRLPPDYPALPRPRFFAQLCLAVCCIAAAPLLAACQYVEAPQEMRGNRLDADQLKELVPGTSTRADAIALLGSPTAKATFDDNTWLYIGQVTQPRIGQMPAVRSQDVWVLSFTDAGVLHDVRHLDRDNAQEVDMVSRTTPSPGSDASFLQQLLGNVGRFSAGGGPAGSGGPPEGGAPR